MVFGRKKQETPIDLEAAGQELVLRCSICTGEQTAGLMDRETGTFHALCLVQDRQELEALCKRYGVQPETVRKIY